MIPILICNRDLLTSVQAQVRFFQQIPEAYIVLCDCASTYPPLVEWYEFIRSCPGAFPMAVAEGVHSRERWEFVNRDVADPEWEPCLILPHELILFPDNRGPRGTQSIIHELSDHDYYFMSDADMDYTGIDPTFLDDLCLGLNSCPEVEGVGVSIRLDDLPQTLMAEYARHVEEGNWKAIRQFMIDGDTDIDFYIAPCDTAGVLRRSVPHWQGGYTGLRSVRHVARHLPWYFTPENTPEDFKHFYANASPRGTVYTSRVMDGSRPL